MGKNVVIFSDGTGQAGGFRFDEDRSNIYKLYRATRCGPDSCIEPREQVAFYDPGLGSQADGGHLAGRFARWVYNIVSQATGFGITANIIDCYAALIRLWEPGDRIVLFGFSRGAYTVRCLAGVIALCGIPTRTSPTAPLRLDPTSTRKLAAYAVKHVYQFTSSRKPKEATWYQKFWLETRNRLASRFRDQHASADGAKANIYPYFIGVFDTVAALGSRTKTFAISAIFVLAAALLSVVISYLSLLTTAPLIGSLLGYLVFKAVFFSILGFSIAIALGTFVYTHIKFDFRVPGYPWWKQILTTHFTEIWQKFYDRDINENAGYAKHAMSIDENRKAFARVSWGFKSDDDKHSTRDHEGNLWFEQVWFSGNHSDIGGSYPENESRLSDIALDWMIKCASVIPDGLKHDPRVLKLSPYPEGVQHDEVKVGLGLFTKLSGITYRKRERELPLSPATETKEGHDEPESKATMHRSVYRRFDFKEVLLYDRKGPYRPNTLRPHVDFARYYEQGAPFPADSAENPTEDAEDPGADKNIASA
jgi:uncharacterized protein (DUF2235 family)